MKVQLVNPFFDAAADIIGQETNVPTSRGPLHIEGNPCTTEDVTAVVGISGTVRGSMYLSMSRDTALDLVSRMLGQPVTGFDELAQSGVAELANVIAGTASTGLSKLGEETTITPPLMLLGAGASLSSVDLQRLVVEIQTCSGDVRVHVAVRSA